MTEQLHNARAAAPALFERDRVTWLAYWMLGYFAYTQAVLGPAMPFLRDELGLDFTAGGLHLSAFAAGMIAAGLGGDALARRFGRRAVFWSGAAGMAAGAALLGLGRVLPLTLSAALLMGGLGGLLPVVIPAALSDRHGPRRAAALTESNVIAMICAGLAPLVVGSAERWGLGWRTGFWLAVAAAAALALLYRHTPLPAPRAAPRGAAPPARLPLLFWALWLTIVLSVAVEWSIAGWGAEFLIAAVGMAQADGATAMSLFFVAAVLGRIAVSRLARSAAAQNLLLAWLGATLLAFPLFWLPRFAPVNLGGLFLLGFGVGGLFPLAISAAMDLAAANSDAASARMTLGAGLAILLAPLTLGWLADRYDIAAAFSVAPFLLLIAVVLALISARDT